MHEKPLHYFENNRYNVIFAIFQAIVEEAGGVVLRAGLCDGSGNALEDPMQVRSNVYLR